MTLPAILPLLLSLALLLPTCTGGKSGSTAPPAPGAKSEGARTIQAAEFQMGENSSLVGNLASISGVTDTSATYSIQTQPSHGSILDFDKTKGQFRYEPNTGFHGEDSVTFAIQFQDGQIEPVALTFKIAPVLERATVNDATLRLKEDQEFQGTLPLKDANIIKELVVVRAPEHGTLQLLETVTKEFIFRPERNFFGKDGFTVQVSDSLNTYSFRVLVDIVAENDAPIANSGSLNVAEDTPTSGQITASDVEGSELIFRIQTQPTLGAISQFNEKTGAFTYAPNPNATGTDRFFFVANDGTTDSGQAELVIHLNSVNDAPILPETFSLTMKEDTILEFSPPATDADGDSLTIELLVPPEEIDHPVVNGIKRVTVTGFQVRVESVADFHGTAGLSLRVRDGNGAYSGTSHVKIQIEPVNDAPRISEIPTLSITEDAEAVINLNSRISDPESDAITLIWVTQPKYGIGAFAGLVFNYIPKANFNGTDSFTFKASDGKLASPTATVQMNILPVNDPPVATHRRLNVTEDKAATAYFGVKDPDIADTFTFQVMTEPAHGVVTILDAATGKYTYKPATHYNGRDLFSYRVTDKAGLVGSGSIEVVVRKRNDAPKIISQKFIGAEDEGLTGTLVATDVDGDPLTFIKVSDPIKGGSVTSFNTTTGVFTYLGKADYFGVDRFKVRVTDGAVSSKIAWVVIVLKPINDPPKAFDVQTRTQLNTSVLIDPGAVDVDKNPIRYELITPPVHGTALVNGLQINYTPNTDYLGPDSFTYQAKDNKGAVSEIKAISLGVEPQKL